MVCQVFSLSVVLPVLITYELSSMVQDQTGKIMSTYGWRCLSLWSPRRPSGCSIVSLLFLWCSRLTSHYRLHSPTHISLISPRFVLNSCSCWAIRVWVLAYPAHSEHG
ncbi:hypothetical protein DEU56DRAFT_503506 [Suillus clintonianus]|uniref:uncharacterized protein n=1 Tax=Suillus clintonianus TaxID=1904413 RepID=UPI001B864E11|nr:uncharacterized protein DEU56DRAFT_503506 [Suillus clintonianus]KAG2129023.1 hypothetical protein DEU56DRAFT_503506 [Suillus clintonianus]